MKCPICNNEMQEGGLVTGDIHLGWIPVKLFNKKIRLMYKGIKYIGKYNFSY